MAIECLKEEVRFRDGTTLVVSEENWLTGVKLLRLQKAAKDSEKRYDDLEREYFRLFTYPRLLAAVIEGTPPPEEEAIMMPASELGKWYDPVKKLNPHWFGSSEEDDDKKDDPKEKKRRRNRKTKSSGSSAAS